MEVASLNASSRNLNAAPDMNALYAGFLALLPKIQTHAKIRFRGICCPDEKADKIAETVGLAWKWYVRLNERGKDISQFLMTFVCLAAKSVKSDRRVCGSERAKDVLSPRAQKLHNFRVESFASTTSDSNDSHRSRPRGQQLHPTVKERLSDDSLTPVPDQVAFRLDFPAFCGTLAKRDLRLLEFLALDQNAKAAATKFGLSQGRITQLRQRLRADWNAMHGES